MRASSSVLGHACSVVRPSSCVRPSYFVLRLSIAACLWLLLTQAGCQSNSAPEVVVYVAVDRAQAEPILKQYEAQSGVRVRAIYDAEAAKTTGLVTRLLAEAQRPRCDVFWNNELAQTLMLAQRGILQPYRSPAAEGIPSELRDVSDQWTGIATRARVIVYNTRHVPADEAPQSIFDLAQPKWRGKVAMANPQFGTTRTHMAALFVALGPKPAQEFLQSLLANEVRIVDGNAMVKNLVVRAHPDASPVYVGLTDTDDVLAGQAAGEPIAMVYPDQETIGTLIVPSTVCLVRGGPNAEAGRRLVDYLVSLEVEAALADGKSGYEPVRGSASQASPRPRPHAMQVTTEQLLQQLEPSSRWTREHFQP
jgi:iron(III) transport system substrate-binding protein